MMNIFKPDKFNVQEAKFQTWKIKENSLLSLNNVIFTYEFINPTTGNPKTASFKSTLNGIVVKELFKINKGDLITAETELFKYEKCTHPIEVNDGMCGVCGEDLRESEEKKKKTLGRTYGSASVSLIHADPKLMVSEKIALEIAKHDLINLVKNKKLVLLVDLDHTLIHTTNEQVNQNIPEVYHYELYPRNVWYHTKFRPGCMKFIEEMSKIFELHMVTFGEKSYANKIANFMDPERKYFHDRILSRNEIFNPISKADNLKDLFPRGDLMVCIIDDREDVWNYARNLICVQPYVFFKSTGDINDPFFKKGRKRKLNEVTLEQQQQQQQLPAQSKTYPQCLNKLESQSTTSSSMPQQQQQVSVTPVDTSNPKGAADSCSDGETNNKCETRTELDTESTQQVSVETTVKNETENKLLAEQTSDSNSATTSGGGDEAAELNNNKHAASAAAAYDPDDYLTYLEHILRKIHDEYYQIYEKRVASHQPQPQLGNNVDESDLPDVKKILPIIKSRVLKNCVLTFSGVVPTGYDLKKQRCYIMAKSLGAKVNKHLILPDDEATTTGAGAASAMNGSDYDESELMEYDRRKYEYTFDDEDSDSNCSGSNYFLKSDDSSSESDDDSTNGSAAVRFSLNDDPNAKSASSSSSANSKTKKKKRPTTHLVAAKYGTIKVHEALKSKIPIKVVTPEWLISCNFKWLRCDENDFKLTKEYDYKNCIFHHEYNYH